MQNSQFLLALFACVAMIHGPEANQPKTKRKPNIIVISDDKAHADYAQWWKKNNDARKNWVLRDKNGKRQNKAFYRSLNPPHVSAAEAEKQGTVQEPTFVLGIAIGDEARVYPLYSIGELVNDTIGKTPIAASW